MKKIFLMVILVAALAYTGCKKDSTQAPVAKQPKELATGSDSSGGDQNPPIPPKK